MQTLNFPPQALGAKLGLSRQAARARLLRPPGSSALRGVCVAPKLIRAFDPGSLTLLAAGLDAADFESF